MITKNRKRLGDLLVEAGVITPEQLEYALKNKSSDEKLGDFLIRENFLTEQQLIEVLEFQLGVPHINLSQYRIDPEVLQLVPAELAKRAQIMPIRKDKNKLFIAMADPMDYFAIEEVRMATGCQIETGIAAKDDLYRTIAKYYDLQESMDAVMADVNVASPDKVEQQITDDDSPIVRLVNQLISNAVLQRASDIHFDPQETEFRVRYRIDGVLRTERSLPKYMQNMITARIKIMGNLNITENRVPQDGRIKTTINFRPVDIRLSTLPTIYGEKIVMRILDLGNAATSINKLGFSKDNEQLFRNMISRPNGIVLITGPTGSGKSTTLYAALSELNQEGVNIITVEDPVEYRLEGINQISYPVSPIIDETVRLQPEHSYLREYAFEEEAAEVAMDFETLSDISDYLTQLSNSPFFKDAQVTSIEQFELGGEEEEEREGDFHEIPRYEVRFKLYVDSNSLAAGGDED